MCIYREPTHTHRAETRCDYPTREEKTAEIAGVVDYAAVRSADLHEQLTLYCNAITNVVMLYTTG